MHRGASIARLVQPGVGRALGRCRIGSVAGAGDHPVHHHDVTSFIPAVVESTPRYERVMDIYSRLLRERIVCLHGPINDALSSVITSQLLFLESEDPGRPLYMYINSPGGVVTAGLAIYDTMQYIKCPITTICVGQAASMGSLLLAGGSPGQVNSHAPRCPHLSLLSHPPECTGTLQRYALPNAKIMLHQPSGGVQGMASDIQIQAAEILRTRARLNLLYQFHTGMNLRKIEQVMDRDTYLTAEDAKTMGVIDAVISTREGSMKQTADLRAVSHSATNNDLMGPQP